MVEGPQTPCFFFWLTASRNHTASYMARSRQLSLAHYFPAKVQKKLQGRWRKNAGDVCPHRPQPWNIKPWTDTVRYCLGCLGCLGGSWISWLIATRRYHSARFGMRFWHGRQWQDRLRGRWKWWKIQKSDSWALRKWSITIALGHHKMHESVFLYIRYIRLYQIISVYIFLYIIIHYTLYIYIITRLYYYTVLPDDLPWWHVARNLLSWPWNWVSPHWRQGRTTLDVQWVGLMAMPGRRHHCRDGTPGTQGGSVFLIEMCWSSVVS